MSTMKYIGLSAAFAAVGYAGYKMGEYAGIKATSASIDTLKRNSEVVLKENDFLIEEKQRLEVDYAVLRNKLASLNLPKPLLPEEAVESVPVVEEVIETSNDLNIHKKAVEIVFSTAFKVKKDNVVSLPHHPSIKADEDGDYHSLTTTIIEVNNGSGPTPLPESTVWKGLCKTTNKRIFGVVTPKGNVFVVETPSGVDMYFPAGEFTEEDAINAFPNPFKVFVTMLMM